MKTEYEFLGISVSAARPRGHHERVRGWNVQTDLGNLHDLVEERYRKQKNFLKKDGTQREPLCPLANRKRKVTQKKVTLCCHSLRTNT